jgi:CMP/dCMP kinase
MIIAIDGPAGAGKGTIATRLGARLGLPVLDTGKLYRLVALEALERGIHTFDEPALGRIASGLDVERLQDPQLHSVAVANLTPLIAQSSIVRAELRTFQRAFAHQPPGAILDGRDIGTVVCPDADVKLYVTASLDTRAARRLKELRVRGEKSNFAQLKRQIAERDERDSSRADSPLRQAEDAHLIDTTDLSIEEATEAAYSLVQRAIIAARG